MSDRAAASSRGRVALVTGASGGIGAATARELAALGHRVVLTYLNRREGTEALARDLGGAAFELDLRDREQVHRTLRRVTEEVGTIEVLVLNAGAIRDALLPFLAPEDWDEIVDVNLSSAYRVTREVIRGMLARRWGRVVAVSSASGLVGQVGQTHYSAAKGGLIAFVKALARETAGFGVTVNCVAPGFVDTEILAQLPEKKLAEYLKGVPLGRVGRPEEVAAAIAFFVSERASYITGQTLAVDGGLVMV
ncbi:MAG: 3-oxoacyl-ACP reductase FabG [Acidobacteria bacterium]|nr:3-oxoacyl-ACP reductase FabG [Acidobacteriota bacterium]MCB9377984.1 3-oxoacyl-ACP reductase FabG [Holophagales bacterium]